MERTAVARYVVQPFERGAKGHLLPSRPQPAPSAAAALFWAEQHASRGRPALALASIVDYEAGTCSTTEVIAVFGDVPEGTIRTVSY